MLLSLQELSRYDFGISGIRVIRQHTTYRQLRMESRKLNGFVYIIQGECRFTHKEGSFTLQPGSMAYLPYGSCHVLDILKDGTEFYRIDFRLTVEQEVVLFSALPLLLCRNAPKECADAVQALASRFEFVQDSISKTELMCVILRSLTADNGRNPGRLAPAISYLSEHLTDKLYCHQLAAQCGLSTSRFYESFRQEYGMTPLAYRDLLLMQRAKLLLQDGAMTVAEISDILGFESAAYFSRFFKKYQGISPSRYLTPEGL